MTESLIAKHLVIREESLIANHLVFGLALFVCDKCGVSCSTSNQKTFIDWDLNSYTVCPPCYDYEIYHKKQQAKRRPHYYAKKATALIYDIPLTELE